MVQQFSGGVLAVTLRIVLRPPPQVIASIFQGTLSLPSQLIVCAGGIASEVKDIAITTANNLVWQVPTHGVAESFDHVEYSATFTGSKVPGADTRVLCAKVVEGLEMAGSKVENVDVVTNSGTIVGSIVYIKGKDIN